MVTLLDDKNMGFALGATDYLTKPIDRQRLMAVLHKCQREALPQTVLLVEDDVPTEKCCIAAWKKPVGASPRPRMAASPWNVSPRKCLP